MQLNNTRLELIYKMIAIEGGPFDCFGDVGTDHAHLPVYMIQQGLFNKAIASDVNTEPLKRAQENVNRAGYRDRITLLLSDGLDKYENECDVICIAGLSGTTIISILESYIKSPWTKEPVFLLQPNTAIADTRKFLSENGFYFIDECVCIDKKHEYPVIKGRFEEKSNGNAEDTVFCHLGKFAEKDDEEAIKYLQIICEKYTSVVRKLEKIARPLNEREELLRSQMNEVIYFIENKIKTQK